MMQPKVNYLPDCLVDDALDAELRRLLVTCFTKPQDIVFKTQRYFCEPYSHRWVIRDERGALVAHMGLHTKQVETGKGVLPVGGIAEVCVHPDYRGRGYVKMMLGRVHAWLSQHGFAFAVLFGDPRVYGSSGYVQVCAQMHGGGETGWKPIRIMVRELSGTPWPQGGVRLPGPTF